MSSAEAVGLAPEGRAVLLRVAREVVEHGVVHGRRLSVRAADYDPELAQQRASFVTVWVDGELHGCIGTCWPVRPLVEDVAHNAYAAAFRDPRFPALSAAELPAMRLHISLLSVPEPVTCTSRDDLLRQLRPGVDGLLLEAGPHRGTLLPAVWEVLPEAAVFLRQLMLKAGLAADAWPEDVRVHRYTAESIHEG